MCSLEFLSGTWFSHGGGMGLTLEKKAFTGVCARGVSGWWSVSFLAERCSGQLSFVLMVALSSM